MLKKLLIVVGALLFLLVAAALAVPFLVDVDKYRPQIVAKANEHINGKLELGKLQLSLWGQIKVNIDGLSITDAAGTKVLGVKDAFFHVPFSSILAMAPSLILKADGPMVMAVKDKQGKLNLMSLVKSSRGAEPATPGATQPAPGSGGGGSVSVPAFVANSRLGIEILHANVTYKDLATDLSTQFPDMNLVIKDLSLTRTADIRFWTDFKTAQGRDLKLQGPIELEGKATPTLAGNKFDHVQLTAKLDMDDMDIAYGTLFHKPKGTPMNADLALTASAREARIEKANAKFANAEIQSSGVISNLGAETSPVVQFQAKSNTIDFKPWSELVPMLKEYELGGTGRLDASATGPADQLGYKANVAIQKLTAKAGKLKAQPVFNAAISVSTDKVDRFSLDMKAPGNDLSVSGSLTSFTAPKLVAQVTSSGMDLDQLIDFPPPSAKKAGGAPAASGGGGGGASSGGAKAQADDYDALLAPLRKNPMMAAMSANLTADIKFIKAYQARMDGVGAKVTFKDLTASLEGFRMKVFDGSIKADFSTALRPAQPTYKFTAAVEGFNIQKAVESQFELFKNTVLGTASLSMSGTGASFNPDPAKANLNAKGSLKVADATFASIDIGRMVTEALNSSIARAAEKVPPLKGKTIKGIGTGSSKYELITSDFTIAGGKFSAPNFVAKAEKEKGIDLNGNTTVGMIDYSLAADWKVIDTYNLTRAADVTVDAAGTQVKALAKGNEPVQFPIHVGGTLADPKYSYTQVPEYFAGVALANLKTAATGKAKAAAQQQIQKIIPKAPPAVQDKLRGLGKKIFGG
ncbi:MAG TPA: AsmA-like C-terminal region-containing protein, partial [Bdellovibrionota bacterium]|nr:AsmA-like C-terminal region-containing protein [Bdellovibrionota bacterium]